MDDGYRSLVDVYERSCDRFADREALGTKREGEWHWLTYAELKDRIDRCRSGLAALGVEAGDRIAIVSNNRVEWAVSCYAAYGLEAVFVPMYEAQLREEWAHVLADSGAKVALCSSAEVFRTISELEREIDGLTHVVGMDLPPEERQSFHRLLTSTEGAMVEARHPEPDALAGFIYTSGTTGMPKGVELSHGNIVSNLVAIQQVFPIEPTNRTLAFLPWAHSFGQTCELHYALSQGAAIAINDEIPNLLENLEEVKPTILIAVPRIFNKIYDKVSQQIAHKPAPIRKLFADGVRTAAKQRKGEKTSFWRELELKLDDKLIFSKIRDKFGGKLEMVISGSASLNREVAEFIDALGIKVYEGYGLSETSPIVSANTPEDHRLGSVGKVIPGVRVEIRETGSPKEGEGEIVVYGPNVMQGYHRLPDETKEAFTEDGGLRTGDLGRFDDDGFLYVTGRIKEQYKLENGKYVMPAVVEEKLKLSPYVSNVMIYGENRPFNVALVVPEMPALEEWAEEKGVELSDPSTDDAVQDLLREEIARMGEGMRRYELPKRIAVLSEDFTTENGMLTPTMKLKRPKAAERYRSLIDELYQSTD